MARLIIEVLREVRRSENFGRPDRRTRRRRHRSTVIPQNQTRVPTTTRRAVAAEFGNPKNGDVITPLKFWGLTTLSTLVARANISKRNESLSRPGEDR